MLTSVLLLLVILKCWRKFYILKDSISHEKKVLDTKLFFCLAVICSRCINWVARMHIYIYISRCLVDYFLSSLFMKLKHFFLVLENCEYSNLSTFIFSDLTFFGISVTFENVNADRVLNVNLIVLRICLQKLSNKYSLVS